MKTTPSSTEPDFECAVIGTGFSGLGMAIALERRGRSYVVLEKDDGVGGTWRANRYPGCACDVPSHLYSFSFEPYPKWTRMFAPQGEILAYLEHCAQKYGILSKVRFRTEVTGAAFDDHRGLWKVDTNNGPVTARYLVFAHGPLSRPAYPDVPGLDTFGGKTMHTATWDESYPLAGKRVAVIGTGASSIQLVPRIAKEVEKLTLFQRTPPWVLPKPDRAITGAERAIFARAPSTQRAYRRGLYWWMEVRAAGFTRFPKVLDLARNLGKSYIASQVPDPTLRAKLTPDYTPGCKRILMADDYYPTLQRANVELVDEAIAKVTETGVVTKSGASHEVDAIVYGTGFRVTDTFTPMHLYGRGGLDINDAWKDGLQAYLGCNVAGFPNLFIMLGPNTGLGHSSMVFMIEAQVNHILSCLDETDRRGAATIEVKPAAQQTFNDELQERMAGTVWASGCKSWYLDAKGVNTAAWPGFTFEYWLRTRRMNPSHFRFENQPKMAAKPTAENGKAAHP